MEERDKRGPGKTTRAKGRLDASRSMEARAGLRTAGFWAQLCPHNGSTMARTILQPQLPVPGFPSPLMSQHYSHSWE